MVDITHSEHEYLNWDAPFNEQSAYVKDAIAKALTDNQLNTSYVDQAKAAIATNKNGSEVYCALANRTYLSGAISLDEEKLACRILSACGVAGIQYNDGFSRYEDGERSHNYVVFDERNVCILGHTEQRVTSESDRIDLYDWIPTDGISDVTHTEQRDYQRLG